jgi:hypothetical protein
MPRRHRPPEHDRVSLYERKLLEQRGLAIAKIDDPYGPDRTGAELEVREGRAPSDNAREWHPPQPRKLVVVRRIANDPVAALLHRRQISKSSFAACREYQKTFEMAGGRGVQSPALEFTPHGAFTASPINDASMAAARRIRKWDGGIGLRFGLEGVLLLRHVIIHNRTLKELAAEDGTSRTDGVGRLFRKITCELAILTGHATARRRTPHLFDRFVVVAIGLAARVAVQEAAE